MTKGNYHPSNITGRQKQQRIRDDKLFKSKKKLKLNSIDRSKGDWTLITKK